MMKPLAVSLGDPAGVGPELIAEAWARRNECALPPFFACGGIELLAKAARARGLDIPLRPISGPEEAAMHVDRGLPVLGLFDGEYRPGLPDRPGAQLALQSLSFATDLALSEAAGGIVTGPIAKARLAEVGFDQPGQTEFVARASGVRPEEAVMMLAGPNLRTVPITVHVSLQMVPQLLTPDAIITKVRIVDRALRRDFGIKSPRIAIAALNPHAGEEGKMGSEEARIIAPAIATLRAEGLGVSGPHPSDALFAPRKRDEYDAAVCMYHDQALIPLKALDFDEGVNVTLGLPIVRTSPDHGTAFDIAGQRVADAGAMIAAIRMAGQIAARRTVAG